MQSRRISRRTCLTIGACGFSAFVRASHARAHKSNRPNILFLLTDDHRWDALGCMGNSFLRTPQLDGLANRGTVFTNAFVTSAICCASRASIFTGQYATRHGVHNFTTPFSAPALADTYPQVLRRNGYRVGFIGKYGVGDNAAPPSDQFDYWKGFTGQGHYFQQIDEQAVHLTDLMARQAVEFIDGCVEDRPFCLSVSFKAPHCQDGDPRQFLYAPRHERLYEEATLPYPATFGDKYFEAQPEYIRTSEARRRWEIRFSSPELYQKMVKGYYRLISGVDDAVGDLLAALRRRGLERNTVIIFMGDNGFFLGEHGLAGKWFMHEESIRVPLLICDPRQPSFSRRRSEMTLNIDLAPTVLSLAGCPIPAGMQGLDLTPLIRGENAPWREDWYYEHRFKHPRIPQSEGIRTRWYSYWRYLDAPGDSEWLFDLRNDPHQTKNLIRRSEYAKVAEQARRRLEYYKTA